MSNWDKDFLEKAHKKSIFNRQEILSSDLCGCFCCLKTYPSAQIKEWVDEGLEKQQTALCPYCGIDSVLGDSSSFTVTNIEFLKAMKNYWFW